MSPPTSGDHRPRFRIRALPVGEAAKAAAYLNRSYAQFAGPIDRGDSGDAEPRCDTQGLPLQYFAAESGYDLLGVMAISARGRIEQWSIEPGDDQDEIGIAMLEAGEAWAREQGASELFLLMPPGAPPAHGALTGLGFRQVLPSVATLRVLDFCLLLDAIARDPADRLRSSPPVRIHLHLDPGPYPGPDGSDFVIAVESGRAQIERGVPVGADARVETTAALYSEMLTGAISPEEFFAGGRARVAPPERAAEARAVLAALRIDRPWFTSLGDRR